MDEQETIISILLDIITDETGRIKERLDYLQSLKARLERLVMEANENETD